jgi:phage tail tape-measure protein
MTNPNLENERKAGTLGAHPVGTGVVRLPAALPGALAGTMAAGPVGTVVGAGIGAVAGGFAGKEIAEAIDDVEEAMAQAFQVGPT